MSVTASNYGNLRAWFALMFEQTWKGPPPAAEIHPVAILDATAAKAPARARQGLQMAINDQLELAAGLPFERVHEMDIEFASKGLPTLSAMRVLFAKQLRAIVRRGEIRTEEEYHLVRNAADNAAETEVHELWRLIEAFETPAP